LSDINSWLKSAYVGCCCMSARSSNMIGCS
jgi:hypothetical protein